MKSIDERAEEWDANWRAGRIELQALSIHHYIHSALTELAADLQAEKEKEVAELRAWKESALKVMPDFQKLGKLLGLPLGSDVSEQLIPAVEKLTATRARLAELEGIAERLSSDLRAVQEEQRGDVFAASIRDFAAYKEGKK